MGAGGGATVSARECHKCRSKRGFNSSDDICLSLLSPTAANQGLFCSLGRGRVTKWSCRFHKYTTFVTRGRSEARRQAVARPHLAGQLEGSSRCQRASRSHLPGGTLRSTQSLHRRHVRIRSTRAGCVAIRSCKSEFTGQGAQFRARSGKKVDNRARQVVFGDFRATAG